MSERLKFKKGFPATGSEETGMKETVMTHTNIVCTTCKNRIFPTTSLIPVGSDVKCEEYHWTQPVMKCSQYKKDEWRTK